jgi:hypothetical protein
MPYGSLNVSQYFGEYVASIIRVEEQEKQETSKKKLASRGSHLIVFQIIDHFRTSTL